MHSTHIPFKILAASTSRLFTLYRVSSNVSAIKAISSTIQEIQPFGFERKGTKKEILFIRRVQS